MQDSPINSNPDQQQQIQESFIMKNYKNIVLLILLCLFILFLVVFFYFFVYLVNDSDEDISSLYQYQIVQYATSTNMISITAECIDCMTYFQKKNNYIANYLNISIIFLSQSQLNLKIIGLNDQYQWQIPYKLPFLDYQSPIANISVETYKEYEITVIYDPLRITISRTGSEEVIFDTMNYRLIYSRLYIEVSTILPSKYIYGLGEKNELFSLTNGTYSIWNREPSYNISKNNTEKFSSNTFGTQPLYLVKEQSSKYHMVYIRNFNAMDIVLNYSDDNNNATLQYRLIGGTFELVFSFGDEYPENAVKMNTDYLGGYLLPPIWAFGVTHLISNYSSISDLTELVESYDGVGLALDVIWMDYEYMDNGNSFTLDTTDFPKASLLEILKTTKLIANIPPCIKTDTGSTAYVNGESDQIFLMNLTGQLILGKNRKIGECVYPDFFNPDANSYWIEMLTNLQSNFNFSGIWLDDNEVYDLAGESVYPFNISSYQNFFNYSDLPYYPNSYPLDVNTIDFNALHYENIKEFDVHSVYAIQQVYSTYNFFNQSSTKSPIPYIMTAGNSAGFSRFSTGHFQDYLPFSWISLKYYLSNMLNYNLFGAPFFGAFLCNGIDSAASITEDIDYELCARWIQLSTFSPLFLVKTQANNNNIFLQDELLTLFKSTIKLRNSLIPYIYTLYLNSTGNSSILKPVFYNFPNDTNISNYSNITNGEFMVGDAFLIAPILEQNQSFINAYFPSANWFDYSKCLKILNSFEAGRFINISSRVSEALPLYLKGGVIVSSVSTTMSNLSNTNLVLHVAFDKNSSGYYVSEGKVLGFTDLYNDTALYENCIVSKCIVTVKAEATITVGTTQTQYSIKLSFAGELAINNTIYITNAQFYGLDDTKCVSFNMGTSYLLKTSNFVTINIYE